MLQEFETFEKDFAHKNFTPNVHQCDQIIMEQMMYIWLGFN
jgi:hypothetical protein